MIQKNKLFTDVIFDPISELEYFPLLFSSLDSHPEYISLITEILFTVVNNQKEKFILEKEGKVLTGS